MLMFEDSLMGKVLIASPTLRLGSYFARTVIYILRNSTDGSVGLIINHPLPKLKGSIVVKHEEENISLKLAKTYSGGPVEIEKGFVLHLDNHVELGVNPLIKLSFDLSLLKAVAKGTASGKNSLFIFGYCGWSSGQLEEEIINNNWLVASPDKKIIFEVKNQHKWNKYLSALNVHPTRYMDYSGNC